MQVLDACPLCRTAVKPGDTRCSDCGADLVPYADLNQLAQHYLDLAREFIYRGESASARHLVERIPQITPGATAELAELRARIAILDGDFDSAHREAELCLPEVGCGIRQDIAQALQARFQAKELYNQALASARNGAFQAAAQLMERAVTFDPEDPACWALKLKVDLKCGHYRRCYDALKKLDRLSARPPEYHGLENLLPPV